MEEEKIGSGYTDIGRRMIALFYEYLDKCRKNGRLATLAGFRAANIIPSDMYEEYSRTDRVMADIIRALLIDEAINFKSAGSASGAKLAITLGDDIGGDDMMIDVDTSLGE